MKPYSTFIFESYSFDPKTGRIALRYSLDDELKFEETLLIPTPIPNPTPNPSLDAALFALHLIGGISYYKTCCPKKIEIRSGVLTKAQTQFWNAVYTKGLGEFFYKNDIDFQRLVRFPADKNICPTPSPSPSPAERGKHKVLLPIGGGKDSIVTLEKLRARGADVTLFRMGSHPLIEKIATLANLPLLSVERHLSSSLFDLNEQGALNGHIPITAYLSSLTIVISILFDFEEVAMSDEKSANEGNIEFKGEQINHQWSKSEEFERMFQEYVSVFIASDIRYASTLRNLTELEIAGEFCTYPQYFDCTTSCNKNWRIASVLNPSPSSNPLWCNHCPKCAFVFALYAAYLPKKTVVKIFGSNLFDDPSLLSLYKQLLGLEGFKPFECVGTAEEIREAFRMIKEQGNWDDTFIMKSFMEFVRPPLPNPLPTGEGTVVSSQR